MKSWGPTGPQFFRSLLSGGQEYPNLRQYLKIRLQQSAERGKRLGIAGGIIGGFGGLLGGLIGVLSGTGAIHVAPQGTFGLWVGLNALLWGAFGVYALVDYRRQKAVDSTYPLRNEANKTFRVLVQSSQRNRLHRELETHTGDLLETSSKYYVRLHTVLSANMWIAKDLPDHWKGVRKQALRAADLAMDEVLVLLSQGFRPDTSPGWQRVLEDLVTSYAGQQAVETDARDLPPGFYAAADIVRKLQSLAAEVERLTAQMAEETQGKVLSGNALDLCLSEIRSLQQAEQELRQHVGGVPPE